MKKLKTTVLLLLLFSIIATGCSRKGVHMPKHRKHRKCNCPTFAETRPAETNGDTIFQLKAPYSL